MDDEYESKFKCPHCGAVQCIDGLDCLGLEGRDFGKVFYGRCGEIFLLRDADVKPKEQLLFPEDAT